MKYLKHNVDALDKEKMMHSYTMVEGGEFADKIETISYEIKMEASPVGGCKGLNVSKYHPKPGALINEEEIKAGKEKATAVFKAAEAYLLANLEGYA
ncbi:major allergen Pru ar 1-like [Eucalyptus grandis]|nr:major allergen Pru ar 1-like [Eucalyptus grandis]